MCNLRTTHACGHVRYRKLTCRANKAQGRTCWSLAFAAAPQCVRTDHHASYELCSGCLRGSQDGPPARTCAGRQAARGERQPQPQPQLLQPQLPQPAQLRARPASTLLLREAAMLPGHFDVGMSAVDHDLTRNQVTNQSPCTRTPAVEFVPRVQRRQPRQLVSQPGRHETRSKRSGPDTPWPGAMSSSSASSSRPHDKVNSVVTPCTETPRWFDTMRSARVDGRVSPTSSGWADPAQNIEANVPDGVEKNDRPDGGPHDLKRAGYEMPSNKKEKKQFCDVVS